MGCLLCGKVIGMYRKLTDAEFCSAGHREAYTQRKESVLVDRLVSSRKRIDKARQDYLARRTPATVSADPALAHYLAEIPAPASGRFTPSVFGPELGAVSEVACPRLGRIARPIQLAGLCQDLPWPAYNAGLRKFPDLGVANLLGSPALDYLQVAAHVLGSWKPQTTLELQIPVAA